jgi:hypothetical protein
MQANHDQQKQEIKSLKSDLLETEEMIRKLNLEKRRLLEANEEKVRTLSKANRQALSSLIDLKKLTTDLKKELENSSNDLKQQEDIIKDLKKQPN